MPQTYLPLQSQISAIAGSFVSRAWSLWFQFVAFTFCNGDPAGAFLQWGTGTPEAVITAPVGSLYLRTNGGASTTLYIKESGTGNTGWIGK